MKDTIDHPTVSVGPDILRVAPENPRSDESVDPSYLAVLADNILEHGVLTPLIGYERDGNFHATAGGRRVRAIRLLSDEGRIPEGFTAPAVVLGYEQAIDAGIAEQLTHEKMTPLDELRIFALDRYRDADDATLARLVGRSARYVAQRRLILSLPDDALDALWKGEITVDQAAGLTYFLGDDDSISELLEDCRHRPITGNELRRHFERQVRPWSESPFRDLVTQEEYVEAGGKLQADLFTEDAFIATPDVLRKLAHQKAATQIADAYADFGFITEVPADAQLWQVTIHPGISNLSEEEEAFLSEWQFTAWTIEDEDEREKVKARVLELQEKREFTYPPELARHLGVGWKLNSFGRQPYDVRIGVLPDDLEPLYEEGWLERPEEPEGAAEADGTPPGDDALSLGGAMEMRIKRIKTHCRRMALSGDVNATMAEYLASVCTRSFAFAPTPDRAYHLGDGEEQWGLKTAAWEKAEALYTNDPERIRAMKPAEVRTLTAKLMLDCMTHQFDRVEITGAMLRKFFAPDDAFWSKYKKPQLIHMILEADPSSSRDELEGMKAAELRSLIAELWPKGDWLPLGF